MQYNNDAFKFVTSVYTKNRDYFDKVANLLDLNPQLIYGALVEEADAPYHNSWFHKFLDERFDQATINKTEQQLQEDYQAVISSGIINDKTGLTGKINTIVHPTMRDVGQGNIRVAVAIKEMEEALGKPIGTELGLQKYIGNYLGLVQDLYDPTGVKSDSGMADQRDTTAIVAIAALHLQRDKDWLLKRVDQDYWNSLPPENQDAILITLYNNGLEAAEKSYQRQIDAYGFYRPTAGSGESGGLNHEINAEKINTELGISGSEYGKHISKLLKDYEFSDLITLANYDNDLGSAIRYALKYNIPSIVIDEQDKPISLYEDTPLFSKENPSGMTSSYIQARVEMLTWKKAYDMADIDYDDRFNALNGLFPAPVDDDHIYQDLSSGLTLDIDGVNPTTLASHYHIFGSDKAETITGGELRDTLFGGAGDDTLIGGAGADYLEGGIGFDTYIVQGQDTIFDSDGKGKIEYANGISIPTLNQIGKNVWIKSEETTNYIAIQKDNNLTLTQQNIKTGTTNQTVIKNYFINTQQNDESITGLGLTLEKNPIFNKNNDTAILVTNPNIPSSIFGGGITKPMTIISSKKADTIFVNGNQAVTVDMQEGNDLIYASTQADIIRGGQGDDIIFGSSPAVEKIEPEKQPQNDNDILYGDLGSDLVYGSLGNDTIYGNDEISYLSSINSNEKGDWLIGGSGNDFIYGSDGRDFLQGGKDIDVIYGGASDDVIIGDSNIRFGSKSQNIYVPPADINYELQPINPIHPLIPPTYTPVPTQPTSNTLTIDYTYSNDKWKTTNLTSLYFRNKMTFDWDITIDTNNNDYQLSTPVALATNELAINSEYAQDFLYGGAGDDLIIGQYGNDILFGEDGDDILWGDDNRNPDIQGNDWLDGGVGNDKLFGGKGSDTLIGSIGRDIMDGGEDYDTYTFSLESLNDGESKTIIDSDGNGRIVINGVDWTQKTWHHDTNSHSQQIYTDGQGNRLVKISDDNYQISSEHFKSLIIIQSQSATASAPLGLQLQEQPNQAPTISKAIEDKTYTADESFSLTLADDLFTDPDNDTLAYTISLSDGNALPAWLHFNPDNNTLTGTPPTHTNISLKLTATDPSGETAHQTFNLQSNSKPTINQPLAPQQYIQTQQGDWTISLNDIFSDSDDQTLTYQISATNGILPAGISTDNQGQLHVDTNIIPKGSYDLTITATDTHGANVATNTQITLVDSLKTPESGFNLGTLGDDTFLVTGSDNVVLSGLSGNDLLKSGSGNDRLNGGLGDDTLIGGQGNDRLIGGFGNDTYIFNKGDGQDRIFDISGKDTIKFGDGISSDDIWMARQGLDLQISLIGSDDKITVEGWFIMPNQRIENIELATGKILSGDNINHVIANMSQTNQNAMNDGAFVNKMEQYWVI